MMLNIHSDIPYQSAIQEKDRSRRYVLFEGIPRNHEPIQLNHNIHITYTILRLIAISVTETGVGVLFLNAQEARRLLPTLVELNCPQLSTPIHFSNTTILGVINNTIKCQWSKTIKTRHCWLLDQMNNKFFRVHYIPGVGNMGDHPFKKYTGEFINRYAYIIYK